MYPHIEDDTMKDATLKIRIDGELLEMAKAEAARWGMDLSTWTRHVMRCEADPAIREQLRNERIRREE